MQLLVSVASAVEALAAVDGGADIIDAKDPASGALGALDIAALRQIREATAARRPLTAALGDGAQRDVISELARAYAAEGAGLVKVGFADVSDEWYLADLIEGAVEGAAAGRQGGGVVAVTYADAPPDRSVDAMSLIEAAATVGARAVLVDTLDKQGPGLTTLWTSSRVRAWVDEAHRLGLIAAVAGRLGERDVLGVRDAGADIAGVRGAVCEGGRTGTVSAERVRRLRASIG